MRGKENLHDVQVAPAYASPAYVPFLGACDNMKLQVKPPPGLVGDIDSPCAGLATRTRTMTFPADIRSAGDMLKASATYTPSHVPFGPWWANAVCASRFEQGQGTLQQIKSQKKVNSQTSRPYPVQRRTKRRCPLLIGTHLRELDKLEPQHIVIVRKLSRLGFDSGQILKEHYERYGPVLKVLLSNHHSKDGCGPSTRLRPSGIGFVVFENSSDAELVLAEGEAQIICGVEISVRKFERRRSDSTAVEESDEEQNGSQQDIHVEEQKEEDYHNNDPVIVEAIPIPFKLVEPNYYQ